MKRLTRWFTNAAILFYLSVIYFSGVPETNTLNARLKEQAMKIAFIVGIWPSWSMFAPNPIRFDTKSYVLLKYRNGQEKEYDVEADTTGFLGTFRKARWMKYAQDNLRNPQQRGLLAPAIRHFRARYELPGNPVVQVQLKRKWRELYPFSEESLPSIFNTPRFHRDEVLISQKVGN